MIERESCIPPFLDEAPLMTQNFESCGERERRAEQITPKRALPSLSHKVATLWNDYTLRLYTK